MKPRDRAEPMPIAGTEGIDVWALAPDGKSIAVVANKGPGVAASLRRLSLSGGPGVPLADSVVPYGLAWLDDGTIVFPKAGRAGSFELWRVSASGGPSSMIWSAESTGALALPAALPASRGVLVVRYLATGAPSIWGVDFRSGTAKSLIRESPGAQYVESGHLVYARTDGSLFAVPFDLDAFEIRGDAIPIMDGVEISFGLLPQFTVSRTGTLVARTGATTAQNEFHAAWVDRTGRATVIDSTWRVRPFTAALNIGWKLSPEGSRLAVGMNTNGNDDIWGPINRWNLKYCVSDEFGSKKQRMVAEMQAATEAWEKWAGVNFVYLPAHDANCAGLAKRLMSPISATNTAASTGPTPGMAWMAR